MDYKDYNSAKDREWIICNGLGGYASSTVIGANTRKYHGLLVASLNPPVERKVLLSSLDEEIFTGNEIHKLAVHKYPGTVYPNGNEFLRSFTAEPCPVFEYEVAGLKIRKQLMMMSGENTTVVKYEIENPTGIEGFFRILPLINNRSVHHLSNAEGLSFIQQTTDKATIIHSHDLSFCMKSDIPFTPDEHFYYNLEYDTELSRGYPYTEDNFNPGHFDLKIDREKLSCFVLASTNTDTEPDMQMIEQAFADEKKRQHQVLEKRLSDKNNDPFLSKLLLAGDSFIVDRKSTGSKSVIAGYHWFGDWGRDTMIALPGLTLVTGRFEDARSIISTFSAYCKEGLIPNTFPENPAETPAYNTIDASLWFVHAAGRYLDYTEDTGFIEKIWPAIEDILNYYQKGTHFGIRMDKDGLIESEGQLTWMDAKVHGIEVTPRRGKACEINALWYNALVYAANAGEILGKDVSGLHELAELAANSYSEKFWNEDNSCLYDCISPSSEAQWKDASIRPNQIIAVFLPNTMLSSKMEKSIVDTVTEKLLTPYGLRTLSPDDSRYTGRYAGNTESRDSAYHNGTVWPWLLGPYISAYRKVYNEMPDIKKRLTGCLSGIEKHLDEAGINTISEVFDGDFPHMPGGCISQAWSVAEILRCYVEDILCEK